MPRKKRVTPKLETEWLKPMKGSPGAPQKGPMNMPAYANPNPASVRPSLESQTPPFSETAHGEKFVRARLEQDTRLMFSGGKKESGGAKMDRWLGRLYEQGQSEAGTDFDHPEKKASAPQSKGQQASAIMKQRNATYTGAGKMVGASPAEMQGGYENRPRHKLPKDAKFIEGPKPPIQGGIDLPDKKMTPQRFQEIKTNVDSMTKDLKSMAVEAEKITKMTGKPQPKAPLSKGKALKAGGRVMGGGLSLGGMKGIGYKAPWELDN